METLLLAQGWLQMASTGKNGNSAVSGLQGGEGEHCFGRFPLIVIRNALEIAFHRRELSSRSQLHGELPRLFCNSPFLTSLAAVSCEALLFF